MMEGPINLLYYYEDLESFFPPFFRAFPWVLEAFEISAYHFYKLIEPAIKHERDFPRSIVKHLNQVNYHFISYP